MRKTQNTNYFIMLILLGIVFVAATNGAISRDMLFFADALYLPLLFRDIFELGGSLSDWYQTPATYWFPDYLLYIPSALLAKTNYMRIAIMAVVQVLATLCVCSYLAKRIRVENATLAGVFVASLLVLSGLGSQWPAVIVFLSAHHYSVILMTVLVLGITLPHFSKAHDNARNSKLIMTLVLLLTVAGVASDRMFVVQGILPIMGALVVQSFCDKKIFGITTFKFIVITSAVLIAGMLLGREVTWHFRRNHPGVEPGILWNKIPESIVLTLKTIGEISFSDPVSAILAAMGIVVCLYNLAIGLKDQTQRTRNVMALTALFSVAAPLAVFVLTYDPAAIARYYGSVFLMPVAMGGLLGFEKLASSYKASLGVVVLILVLILLRAEPWNKKVKWSFVPEHVACVEEHLKQRSLNSGIADYWDSMVLMGMTDNRINVAHFTPGKELKPYRWIATERHVIGRYDFAAIVEDPKFRLILPESLGEPREVLRCGKLELRIFGKGELRLEGL